MREFREIGQRAVKWFKKFLRADRGNTAMIFGLASVGLITAGGAGIDFARAMVVKTRMSEALDAAALAIGTTNGLSNSAMQTMAQQYFNANYPTTEIGSTNAVTVSMTGQTLNLSVTGSVPTTLLKIINVNTLNLSVTNQVVRSVTKLRVALVLDNTGSMTQTDGTGTSKISALKTATNQLLTQLQNAAVNPGDVQVALVPFSKDVEVGSSNVNVTWIDWTDWNSAPPSSAPSTSIGPGSSCPYGTNTSPYGYSCTTSPTNGSSTTSTIPSSGTYSGYICPGMDSGNYNTGGGGHYYNGCYNSTASIATICTGNACASGSTSCNGHVNCTCTGNGNGKSCKSTTYNHAWITNNHNTWAGCIMDRAQSNDVNNTSPVVGTASTLFPAENDAYCPPASLMGMSYTWSSLTTAVNAMTANGSTNQPVGLAWGWEALSQGAPLNAPAADNQTTQVIILLSDGLNTQDRWYGDGSNQSSQVDAREALICTNAKAAGIVIYTLFVDLGGTTGNSAPLQACASDSSKYYDLTTSGQIVTAFNTIGTELANLHLSQ